MDKLKTFFSLCGEKWEKYGALVGSFVFLFCTFFWFLLWVLLVSVAFAMLETGSFTSSTLTVTVFGCIFITVMGLICFSGFKSYLGRVLVQYEDRLPSWCKWLRRNW